MKQDMNAFKKLLHIRHVRTLEMLNEHKHILYFEYPFYEFNIFLVDIPPFEKLMFGHENGEFAAFRFKLLKWSLKCDKLSSLDGVPDVFVPVVLTLNFIVQVHLRFFIDFSKFIYLVLF